MDRGAVLAVAVPLIAFKIWFAILLLTFYPTADAVVWIAATHWPLVIIVALLIAGPGIAWWRLVRVRARRARLQRAEWMGESLPTGSQAARTPTAPQWPLWETVSRLEDGD